MSLTPLQAREMLRDADMVCSQEQVQAALHRMAEEIGAELGEQRPLVLAVMGGAVVFVGQLLPLLEFPLEFDYVHLSRYGDAHRGGQIQWKVAPGENVRGRIVLALDDILDEGHTLAALRERVLEMGAAGFYSAVFADKRHGREKPIRADFVGVEVPDRFVFGFGMDASGLWRNLPAIYALKEKK